jgi:hypothetical protein
MIKAILCVCIVVLLPLGHVYSQGFLSSLS